MPQECQKELAVVGYRLLPWGEAQTLHCRHKEGQASLLHPTPESVAETSMQEDPPGVAQTHVDPLLEPA